jgi:hypothetical protein
MRRPKRQGIEKRRLDAMIDAYVLWREACACVRVAYGRWQVAPVHTYGEAEAFDAYLVALDEEADAANEYATLVRSPTPSSATS